MGNYRKAMVTGGCGFIGRWVVGELLEHGLEVAVLDDLSNSTTANLDEFAGHPDMLGLTRGSITEPERWDEIEEGGFDVCFHLAASINVQDSINDPRTTFDNDVTGTFLGLEYARRTGTRFVFVSTCMVYAPAEEGPIGEEHPVLPVSPYAGSKLAAENLTNSYYYAYRLPTLVLRPFNTYGPFQRTDGEGGVVATFVSRKLAGQTLQVYGDGTQTRDLLYVTDCARFIVEAGLSGFSGRIINAGYGEETRIIDLADMIADGGVPVELRPHIHPQSEVQRLLSDNSRATTLLGWKPEVELGEGIKRLEGWLK
ncbi:MAG: NAD-dependent epimerase/dehydratase family protein [bacterium]|nr:NAD-dependent epimerase/dehydratase family protein [bacterium]